MFWFRARVSIALSSLLALAACAGPPACPQNPAWRLEASANAGCLVRSDGRMLVVRDRLSGKLGLPAGGAIPPEPAHCTALRETWEETGFRVMTETLLEEFAGGFRLYHCRIEGDFKTRRDVPRPPRAIMEIESIHWLLPGEIFRQDWRFPGQLPRVLELFDALPEN